MKIIIICMIFFAINIFSQSDEEYRLKDQFYYEDSTNVYWISTPNPFAPPTIIDDYTKGLYCGDYTFHCDLSDTVIASFQNYAGSTLYSAKVISTNPPFFSLCLWIAGSRIISNELPNAYYRANGNEKLNLVLIVNGHRKCYRKISMTDKKYYWLNVN